MQTSKVATRDSVAKEVEDSSGKKTDNTVTVTTTNDEDSSEIAIEFYPEPLDSIAASDYEPVTIGNITIKARPKKVTVKQKRKEVTSKVEVKNITDTAYKKKAKEIAVKESVEEKSSSKKATSFVVFGIFFLVVVAVGILIFIIHKKLKKYEP